MTLTAEQVPAVPGDYTSGADALRDYVELVALEGAARDQKQRLQHALSLVDKAITDAVWHKDQALKAVQHFAEFDPASLGVAVHRHMAKSLADNGVALAEIEQDVADLLRRGR